MKLCDDTLRHAAACRAPARQVTDETSLIPRHEPAMVVELTSTPAKSEPRDGSHEPNAPLRLLKQVIEAVSAWRERARQRRDLACLNERLLRDIGLSRADVEGEMTKRFWQN